MPRSRCEIWSRCCGYLRPTDRFNDGKLSEFKDRVLFKTEITINNKEETVNFADKYMKSH